MKRTSKALFGAIFIFTALMGSSSATHKSLLTHSSKNQTPIKISEKWIPKGYWSILEQKIRRSNPRGL